PRSSPVMTGRSEHVPFTCPCDQARNSAADTPSSSAARSRSTPRAANHRHRASTFRLNLSLDRYCFVCINLTSTARPHAIQPPSVTTGHGEYVRTSEADLASRSRPRHHRLIEHILQLNLPQL